MIYLYVIRSQVNGYLYVEICKDLTNRLKEHNRGRNRYTKGLRPWEIVHSEQFPDWSTARAREKYYKSGVVKKN